MSGYQGYVPKQATSSYRHSIRQRPRSSQTVAPPVATTMQQSTRRVITQPQPDHQRKPQAAISPRKATPPEIPSRSNPAWEKFVPRNVAMMRESSTIYARTFAGYRQQDVEFKNTVSVPLVQSSNNSGIDWSGIGMYEVGAEVEYTHPDGWLKHVQADALVSYANTITDAKEDFAFANAAPTEDDVPVTFSGEGKAEAMQAKFALGYQFDIGQLFHPANTRQYSWATPVAGYAYQTLDLDVGIPAQTLSDGNVLPSTMRQYNSTMKSPFIGVKAGTRTKEHRFQFRGEVHYADYEADIAFSAPNATPLRLPFAGDAIGFQLGADYSYFITESLALNMNADYHNWGLDGEITSSTSVNGLVIDSNLDEVELNSQAYRVGVAYAF